MGSKKRKQPSPKLAARVEAVVDRLLARDGQVTYPSLLVELGMLSAPNVEAWRAGRVPYLERVVYGNLMKLARIQTAVRHLARLRGLQRRVTASGAWPARFSKTGAPGVEDEYRAVYGPGGAR